LNELEPKLVKAEASQYFTPSIDVSTPTMAVMPKAMIKIVSTERVRFVRIEWRAWRRFS
jgi:hypothetical protein